MDSYLPDFDLVIESLDSSKSNESGSIDSLISLFDLSKPLYGETSATQDWSDDSLSFSIHQSLITLHESPDSCVRNQLNRKKRKKLAKSQIISIPEYITHPYKYLCKFALELNGVVNSANMRALSHLKERIIHTNCLFNFNDSCMMLKKSGSNIFQSYYDMIWNILPDNVMIMKSSEMLNTNINGILVLKTKEIGIGTLVDSRKLVDFHVFLKTSSCNEETMEGPYKNKISSSQVMSLVQAHENARSTGQYLTLSTKSTTYYYYDIYNGKIIECRHNLSVKGITISSGCVSNFNIANFLNGKMDSSSISTKLHNSQLMNV